MKEPDQRAQRDGSEGRHHADDQRKAAKNQEIDFPFTVTSR